jgi:hypothetical protein
VSDIGIVFPWWFTLGAALMIALPVTTAIMVGLGVAASRARHLGHARRLTGVKWRHVHRGSVLARRAQLRRLGHG